MEAGRTNRAESPGRSKTQTGYRVMRAEYSIEAIDTHTAGEPTRVITGGVPPLPGATLAQQMTYFSTHLDHLRTALVHEPRGHRDMVGAVVGPPASKQADAGVFFLDRERCFGMCGHGTMGVAVALVTSGRVEMRAPETTVVLDTPEGLVTARVDVEGGEVAGVTVRGVPSYTRARDVPIALPDRQISADVAFGGRLFALVDADGSGSRSGPRTFPGSCIARSRSPSRSDACSLRRATRAGRSATRTWSISISARSEMPGPTS
jgi:proline racemase